MLANHVVINSCIPLACLFVTSAPSLRIAAGQLEPSLPVQSALQVQAIGYQGSAHVPIPGVFCNRVRQVARTSLHGQVRSGQFLRGQQVLGSDSVAELLYRSLRQAAAHAGLSKPQVRQLVQQRQRPSTTVVVWIEHHKRQHVISQTEAAEEIGLEASVVAAEVSKQNHEYACGFYPAAEPAKRLVDTGGLSVFVKWHAQRPSNRRQDGGRSVVHVHGAHEGRGLGFVDVKHCRLEQRLSGLGVADQRVQPRVVGSRAISCGGSEIVSPSSLWWGLRQVERCQRSAILAGHLGQHRAGGNVVPDFQRVQAVHGLDSPCCSEPQSAGGFVESESGGRPGPPKHFRADLGHAAPVLQRPTSALKKSLKVPWVWARCCARNPIMTIVPSPWATDTMAAFPAIASSPRSHPLWRMSRST